MKKASITVALLTFVSFTMIPLPNEYRARWTSFLLDAAHVPLMATAVVLLAQLVRLRIAVAAVTIGSVLLEATQMLLASRTFSLVDLQFNVIGIVVGTLLIWVVRLSKMPATRKLAISLLLILLALIPPALHCGPYLVDAYHGVNQFPVIAEFSSGPISLCRWYDPDRRIRLEKTDAGESVGVFEVSDSKSSILLPIVRDWSSASSIYFSYQAEEPGSVDVSVRDGKKIPEGLARHYQSVDIIPGRHTVQLDLSAIARGGKFAPVDLTRIQSFHLFLEAHRNDRTGAKFRLEKIWVE